MQRHLLLAGLLALGSARAEATTLLLVGDDARVAQPRVQAVRQLAERSGWTVLRWRPGAGVSGAFDGGEVVVAGGVGEAGKAAAALTRSALAWDLRRLVIRFPMDALYGDFGPMDRLEDAPGFYAKTLVPDWLPADAAIPAARSLRFDVLDGGKPHSVLARGSGAHEVAVLLDITDSVSLPQPLLPTAPSPQRPNDSKRPNSRPPVIAPSVLKAINELPGTPLETGSRPGLWFGRGGEQPGAGWGTVSRTGDHIQFAHAEGTFRTTNEEGGFGFGEGIGQVNADWADQDGVKRGRLDVAMMGEHNGASFRFLQQSQGLDSYTLLRAGLMRRDHFGLLRNDANVKLGYLMENHSLPGGGASDRGAGQLLYGGGDTLSLPLDLGFMKVTAQAGADAVWSQREGVNQWDNYRLHGGVEAVVPLRQDLHLLAQYKHRLLEQNPEKYFFTPHLSDDQGLAGLAWKKGGFGAGVMAGLQKIRGEQADDDRKKGALWLTAWDTTLTAMASRGDWTEEVTLALSRRIAQDWNVEAYANRDSMVRYDYKQDTVGLRVSWGFGGGSDLPDERRYRPQRDDIYAQRFYKDKNLPQDVFAAQTSSVRQVNEWSGSNLKYVTGDANKWARKPEETYGGRAGDCDEQAWLVSRSLNDNKDFRARGGEAYILDYWAGISGHGVSLIKEGGHVYVNEYGRTRRLVGVDPNASMETLGREALRQTGRYLALKPVDGKPLQFVVFGTKDDPAVTPPGGYDMTYLNEPNRKSAWTYDPTFASGDVTAQEETGINALLGADAF